MFQWNIRRGLLRKVLKSIPINPWPLKQAIMWTDWTRWSGQRAMYRKSSDSEGVFQNCNNVRTFGDFTNWLRPSFFSFASRIFEKLPWSYFVFKLSEILCKFFDLIVLFRFDLLFGRLNIHEHSARNRIELRGLGQSIQEKKNKNQFFAQFDFRLDFCRVPIMKKIDTLGNLGQWKAL